MLDILLKVLLSVDVAWLLLAELVDPANDIRGVLHQVEVDMTIVLLDELLCTELVWLPLACLIGSIDCIVAVLELWTEAEVEN